MPEARDRLPERGAVDSPSAFQIRRGHYVADRSRNGNGVHQSVSDNKENIPPEISRSRRRRALHKKSPLPSWYPRTPLRDVTAIVAAMERRRIRLRKEAEMRRRNQDALNSPRTPVRVVSSSAQEPSVCEDTPQTVQAAQEPSVCEDTPQTVQAAQEPSPSEETSRTVQASVSNTPEILENSTLAESSPQRVKNPPNDASLISIICTNDLSHFSIQKKLASFEEIEKVVRNCLKESKKTQKQSIKQPSRNTLMSMR